MKDKESDVADFEKIFDSEYMLMALLKRATSVSSNDKLTSDEVKKFSNIMNNSTSNERKKISMVLAMIKAILENKTCTRYDLTNINQLYEKSAENAAVTSVQIYNMQHEFRLAYIYKYLNDIKNGKTKDANEMFSNLNEVKDAEELQKELSKIDFEGYKKNVLVKLIDTLKFKNSKKDEKEYKKELLNMYSDDYIKDKENEFETVEGFNSAMKDFKESKYEQVLTKGIKLINELYKDKINNK